MRLLDRRRPTPRPRRGLTLVEVLVALVLVAVGLLGMAGSGSLLLRQAAEHDDRRRAVRRAAARIAALSAAGCAAARSGMHDAGPAGLRESWWLAGSPADGALLVTDSVAWTSRAGRRTVVLHSAMLC